MPQKFTYIWLFEQVEIIATKFEKKQSLNNSGIFVAATVFDAQAAY